MILNLLKRKYNKFKNALKSTGSLLGSPLKSLFSKKVDEEALEKLEQILYEADLGVTTALELTEHIRNIAKKDRHFTGDQYIDEIRKKLHEMLDEKSSAFIPTFPSIILIVGVNGNGKTTTCAKLAKHLQAQNHKVLLTAADTFRAAAVEQLEKWAKKLSSSFIKGEEKKDPASVVYDALEKAKKESIDVTIIDTAGRLQTKTHLMEELKKIHKVCNKICPNAHKETLLVVDATTGQNAIDQAKVFSQYTPLTGLIITKLDGTAKGGIVLSIQRELNIPIRFIGVGEGIDDLEPFDAKTYIDALLS